LTRSQAVHKLEKIVNKNHHGQERHQPTHQSQTVSTEQKQTTPKGVKQRKTASTVQNSTNSTTWRKIRQTASNRHKQRQTVLIEQTQTPNNVNGAKQHWTVRTQLAPNSVKTAQTASNGVFKIQNSASATKKIHQQIYRQPPVATKQSHDT
jgi:hypothetical protein